MSGDSEDYTEMELSADEVQLIFDKLKAAVHGHVVGAIVYATGAMLASVFRDAASELGPDGEVDLDILMPELRRIIEKTTTEIKSVN